MKIPLPAARRRARIEIIPLIDIVFFLLATFVMVSLSMVKNQGIPVNLPASATGASQDRSEHTMITVTESGDIYFNKEKISRYQLKGRLQSLKSSQRDPKIFINGDEKASLGATVSVLDEIRSQGLTKVSIQTTSKSAS